MSKKAGKISFAEEKTNERLQEEIDASRTFSSPWRVDEVIIKKASC